MYTSGPRGPNVTGPGGPAHRDFSQCPGGPVHHCRVGTGFCIRSYPEPQPTSIPEGRKLNGAVTHAIDLRRFIIKRIKGIYRAPISSHSYSAVAYSWHRLASLGLAKIVQQYCSTGAPY